MFLCVREETYLGAPFQVDVSKLKLDAKFNDKYFARPSSAKKSEEFVASAEKVRFFWSPGFVGIGWRGRGCCAELGVLTGWCPLCV